MISFMNDSFRELLFPFKIIHLQCVAFVLTLVTHTTLTMFLSDRIYRMEMADKLHNQCKESDLWLLIQYERPQNVYNYDIIHSSEVVQKDKMHTGKTIDFRFGNSILKAVIFIISGNRRNEEENENFGVSMITILSLVCRR